MSLPHAEIRNGRNGAPRGASSEHLALQRIHVLWGASTALLLLLLAILTVLVGGHLSRQAAALNRHEQALDDLRARLLAADMQEPPPAEIPKSERAGNSQANPTSRPADDAGADRANPASQPAAASRSVPRALTISTESGRGNADVVEGPAPTRLTPEAVEEALARLMIVRDDLLQPQITDQAEARRLLDVIGDGGAYGQGWSGRLWSRLALLAAVMGREPLADVYAYRAGRQNFVPRAYLELTVARHLRAGRVEDALQAARRLGPRERLTPRSRVALAAAHAANWEWAEADEHATALAAGEGLFAPDRLLLAEALARLERWDGMREQLAQVQAPGAELQAAADLLRAQLAIHDRDFEAALTLLDRLLESRPEDLLLRMWRAVALLRSGRSAEAGEALKAVESALQASRSAPLPLPLAYWRGMLALADGQTDAAREQFQQAVSERARCFQAWEALAALDANQNRLDAALEHSARAIEAYPQRAEGHYLRALIAARRGERETTQAALAEACRLNPALAEEARRVEVFQGLLGARALEQIATGSGAEPASGPASQP